MRGLLIFILKVFILFFYLLFSTGCESEDIIVVNNEVGEPVITEKINLLNATPLDIEEYIIDCGDSERVKLCLLICHVPPGNPMAAHSKVLPLSASLAHLRHHSKNKKKRKETFDYLGECSGSDAGSGDESDSTEDDSNSEADDGSGDEEYEGPTNEEDPSGGDGEEGEGEGEETSGDDEGERPDWCEVNQEVDADCDGIDDSTGQPIY